MLTQTFHDLTRTGLTSFRHLRNLTEIYGGEYVKPRRVDRSVIRIELARPPATDSSRMALRSRPHLSAPDQPTDDYRQRLRELGIHRAAAFEGSTERQLIGVFEVATDRQP